MYLGLIAAGMILYSVGVLTGVFVGYQIRKETERHSNSAKGATIKDKKGER